MRTFVCEQPAFNREWIVLLAAHESTQSVRCHDAMTRHDDGDRIFSAGSADRARRRINLRGELTLGQH